MEDSNNHNKILQEELGSDFEYKYNFINIPWDDRTTTSKVGIVSLLVTIFAATLACVSHNLVSHFGTSTFMRTLTPEVKCHLVRVDEYPYAARIHSIDTQELLCVGAVISPNAVIANGVCVKAGSVRLRVGSPAHPRCKKGFSVDVIDPIYHEGTVSKHLVLLTSYENMEECVQVIKIGNTLNWDSRAYIIGRPLRGGRSLSRQPAKLAHMENLKGHKIFGFAAKKLSLSNTVCVKDLARCPVRAGDLLVQGGRVFGLASTSTHATQSRLACFADLRVVMQELNEHDTLNNLQKTM